MAEAQQNIPIPYLLNYDGLSLLELQLLILDITARKQTAQGDAKEIIKKRQTKIRESMNKIRALI